MATEGTGACAARELGQGWKVSPSHQYRGRRATVTLADIEGPGAIQHIWITVHPTHWRRLDPAHLLGRRGDARRSRCPLGDFFCSGWGERCNVSSLPIAVNPAGGFNCYWEMPFRKSAPHHAREPEPTTRSRGFYYQIDYTLTEVPDDAAYFHAQWRREQPAALQGRITRSSTASSGQGHYVGTYLAWGVNNTGWWGEGEIKFFMDGDGEFPTICGTGTEDYFGGAWNFEHPTGRVRRVHRRPSSACRRSSRRTGSTAASSASACTAGTSWTRSASSRTCA